MQTTLRGGRSFTRLKNGSARDDAGSTFLAQIHLAGSHMRVQPILPRAVLIE